MSNRKTASPILVPSTRMTFVAPRLPEPCLRRSTPLALPAMYAAGIDPSRYDPTIASNAGPFIYHSSLRRWAPPLGVPGVGASAGLATEQNAERVPREAPVRPESVV